MWIQPGWSAGGGQRELNCVVFVAATTIASKSMVFEYGTIIDALPCGFTLLEETLTLMGSIKDQHKLTPKGALVRRPKDFFSFLGRFYRAISKM